MLVQLEQVMIPAGQFNIRLKKVLHANFKSKSESNDFQE